MKQRIYLWVFKAGGGRVVVVKIMNFRAKNFSYLLNLWICFHSYLKCKMHSKSLFSGPVYQLPKISMLMIYWWADDDSSQYKLIGLNIQEHKSSGIDIGKGPKWKRWVTELRSYSDTGWVWDLEKTYELGIRMQLAHSCKLLLSITMDYCLLSVWNVDKEHYALQICKW